MKFYFVMVGILLLLMLSCRVEETSSDSSSSSTSDSGGDSSTGTTEDYASWPLSKGTQVDRAADHYGPRILSGSYDFHRGIDIAYLDESTKVTEGVTPIYSILDGTVVRLGSEVAAEDCSTTNNTFKRYGNFLVVHHGDYEGEDLQSVYLHLDSIAVALDQTVQEGELIGYVGNTGCNINTVHLHFETYTGVTPTGSGNIQRLKTRNPFRFLPYTSVDPTADATRDSQYINLNLSQPRDGADIVRVAIENDVTGDLVIDFESRAGMNSDNDDETPYQGIEVSPVDFKNSSELYEMTLHYDASILNGGSASGTWSGLGSITLKLTTATGTVRSKSITF